jgi:flagella basal body P-ring formation protein FlgA
VSVKRASLLWIALAMTPVVACAREETVLERAHDVLLAALQEKHADIDRFELTPLGPGLAKWQGMDARSVEFLALSEAAPGKRARTVVRYDHLDGSRREDAIWWSIRAMGPVLVTRRTIRANEAVTASDVALETADVAGLKGALREIRSGGPVLKARRHLAAGKALQISDLEAAPEVDRDQRIKVRVGAGPVLIETVGIAEEAGRLGEIIRVSNPASGMRYSARISAAGEVTVGGQPE